MARLLDQAIAIEVTADREGLPLAFRWKGHLHQVTHIANRWRVHTHWWRREIWREHFKVSTRQGLLCILYHDLLADCWHLERVYD
jgi:hypothetical protein